MILFPVLFFLLLLPNAFSEITINADFSGTIVITFPDGDIALLEAGDPLPSIPAGSSIEVFDGAFSVKTGTDESVSVGCLGSQFSVSGGSSATVTCGDLSGTVNVEGEEHIITAPDNGTDEVIADPTADIAQPGIPIPKNNPVNSRDIRASVSS